MISFKKVKEMVTARDAAEYYGIQVNRRGFARCPFHPDRTPSMKVGERYYCFGCLEKGDVIDFTAKLFHLDLKSAAEKLAEDFHIDAAAEYLPSPPVLTGQERQRRLEEEFNACWKLYCEHLMQLLKEERKMTSANPEDGFDPRHIAILRRIESVNQTLDQLSAADWEGRREIMDSLKDDVRKISFSMDKGEFYGEIGS